MRRHGVFVTFASVAFALQLVWPARASAQPADEAAPLFDDTVVHDIRLAINSRDWQTLREQYLFDGYYPTDLKWQNVIVRNAGIRSRGNGSRSGIKPGLRIDFDRYTTNQKFLGLKSFVLRNNTQDPSNLHERVSMLFFRRVGLLAPREAHARLFVNDEYAGMYTIVESVDRSFLGKAFGDDTGYLYDYTYPATDLPYYFEYRGADPSLYVPKPFKPETHESDPRPEVIERMIWTINNTSEAVFRSAIAEFLDLGKFIRHVAAEVFLGDSDGFIGNWGMNNFYIHRLATNNVFTFIAWDKSHAFSGLGDYPIFHNITDVPEAQRNRLFGRVLAYPDLRNQFLDTLIEFAASASEIPPDAAPDDPSGWLEREIDREYRQISEGVRADTQKPYTNEEFDESVRQMKLFARERGRSIRDQVAASR
jgi:spore coat protein CotH